MCRKSHSVFRVAFFVTQKGETLNEDTTRISVLEEQVKVANHRISDLEDTTKRIESLTLSVEKLALSVEKMAEEQSNYKEKHNEIMNRLSEVESIPYKSKAAIHDKVVGYILTFVLGAILTYLSSSMF